MPAPLSAIIEDLNFQSDLLSTRVRTIAVSTLALVWLFLAGGSSSPVLPVAPDRNLLLGSGALALGALVFDYLQYLIGYWVSNSVRHTAEKSTKKEADYNYTDRRYKARTFFFWVKQALMVPALVCLGIAVLSALLHK